MDDLLSEFLTEADENLAALDEALLTFERSPHDEAAVGRIFRLVHNIKGTCGFFGLPQLKRVAHTVENVIGLVREHRISATPVLITAVLQAADVMREIVKVLAATGTEPMGADPAIIATLETICAGKPFPCTTPAPAELAGLQPGPATSAGHACQAQETSNDGRRSHQTIRISVEVLEHLTTLVNDLVVTRNQLLQINRTGKDLTFAAPVQRLSQITSDLQEGVMKIRLQPIGSVWSKLPRLVRDLAQELGKPMNLQMIGAETAIDRRVLELVRDPFTHMVRNSADHGLESPAERQAAGKPETGTITLKAYYETDRITVEIADDGRGFSADRIREQVRSKGLATEAELSAMGDQVIQRFIFNPGFSTAAQVTSVSGRGVGMDVVKTNIERIGGTIELHSHPGAGTTFLIKLPPTLTIVSALIVESAGERFALAQSSVAELLHTEYLSHSDDASENAEKPGHVVIETTDGTPVLRLRDRLLPLVTLSGLLQLTPTSSAGTTRGAYVVVVSVGSDSLGIVVDRVFAPEKVVVTPVSPVLPDTLFNGTTMLGDGTVIMILDPNGIAHAVNTVSQASARPFATANSTGAQCDGYTGVLRFRADASAPKTLPLGAWAGSRPASGSWLTTIAP